MSPQSTSAALHRVLLGCIPAAAAVGFIALAPGIASAAPLSTAASAVACLVAGSGPTSAEAFSPRCDINGTSAMGFATASDTVLSGFAEVDYRCCGSAMGASTLALWSTTVGFTGPPGTFSVAPLFSLTYSFDDPIPKGSYAVVQLTVNIGTYTWDGSKTSDGRSVGVDLNNLPTVNLLANQIYDFRVYLRTYASGQVGQDEKVHADASHTLTLPRTGPVFLLPEGYTADIPDLHVFNNQFVDPAAVPEPASLAAIGFGLLFLAVLWRVPWTHTDAAAALNPKGGNACFQRTV